MMTNLIPTITEMDAASIREMSVSLRRAGGIAAAGELLDWVSSEAEVVPAHRIAPDIVTLGASVSFKEADSPEVFRVTVVHPVDMSLPERRISVLSPVGRALLGRRAGEFTKVTIAGGTERRIQVLEVHSHHRGKHSPHVT